MRLSAYFFLVTLYFLSINPVSAEIYQYVDSKGTIHFTNVPTDPRYKKFYPAGTAPPAAAQSDRSEIPLLIEQISRAHRISPALIKAIIRAESNFNPRAVSSAGAQGLMQLMPATAEDLKLGDPFDPAENIQGGTRYLRYLLDRFNQDVRLAIAAYHAGPGNVSRHGGVPPIEKTKQYLKKVLRFYEHYLGEAEQRRVQRKSPKAEKIKKTILAQSSLSIR